ncbi:vWA domain-containing protein [Lacticaseibacillus hulanensis]|uniref:vWA domain-containing protein n=1 Tax=Lacticaseibacillus hulanensis TaxID=2493111 RepID=UPI000FDB9507|nr:vWA domain-containing protein [Lacticaseibacillus hulanensis]
MVLVLVIPLTQAIFPALNANAGGNGDRIPLSYTTDQQGTRPADKAAWHLAGDNDVLNHIGGQEGNSLFKTTGIETKDSDSTYLKFGKDKSNPDYQIRKYATQTTTPGKYQVHLDVKGSTRQTKDIKPLDIVFVVDMSGSMEIKDGDRNETQRPHEKTEIYNGRQYYRSSQDDVGGYEAYVDQSQRYVIYRNNGNWYLLGQDWNGPFRKQIQVQEAQTYQDANTKAQALREGLKAFTDQIAASSQDVQKNLNVGLVAFSSNGYPDNNISLDMKPMDGNQGSQINAAVDRTFEGGTFTQDGLKRGEEMLKSKAQDGHKQIMIVLSDGVPTSSYRVNNAKYDSEAGIAVGTSFDSHIDGRGNTSLFLWGNDYVANGADTTEPYNVGGQWIKSTWAATIGEARNIQVEGTDIRALGIQLTDDDPLGDNQGLSKDVVQQRFSQIASKDATGKRQYEDADTPDAIKSYLMKEADQIVKEMNNGTVADGSITDPLGAQYSYADPNKNVEVSTEGGADKPTAEIKNNQLDVSGINLGAGQTLRLSYNVKLNTDTDDFVSGKWYQMNGETTFKPTPTDDKVNFGIPSGRGYGATLMFEKFAQGAQYGGNQLENAEFEVDGPNNKTTTLSDKQKTMRLRVGKYTAHETKSPDGYKLDKTPIAFSYDGQKVTVNGGDAPQLPTSGTAKDGVYQDGAKAEADKQFVLVKTDKSAQMHYSLRLKKIDSKTGNLLAGAKFQLKGPDGTTYNGETTTDKDGITFNGLSELAPGDYELTETSAPDGYARLIGTVSFQIDSLGRPVKVGNDTMAFRDGGHEATTNNLNLLKYSEFDMPYNKQVGVNLSTGGSDATHQTMTITLADESQPKLPDSARLPMTGGPGILPYVLLTLALVLTAGGLYWYWKGGEA